MCTEALVNGEWCENLGELEKAIGGACVGDYGEHRSPESCLCPVDWQATAAAHGLIARDHGARIRWIFNPLPVGSFLREGAQP
jgi:hypothetical protein